MRDYRGGTFGLLLEKCTSVRTFYPFPDRDPPLRPARAAIQRPRLHPRGPHHNDLNFVPGAAIFTLTSRSHAFLLTKRSAQCP